MRENGVDWRHPHDQWNYANLDVLVVSSDNEGTPVLPIEAMGAGFPVVATRVGGLSDLIDNQRAGRLVPLRDKKALAGAVLDLLRSPAPGIGPKGVRSSDFLTDINQNQPFPLK